MILEFAPFELDIERAELRTASGPIALEPKAFNLLRLLVENNERVISKEEMIAVVWGGRFISDAAVSTVLKLVRRALGDDGETQSFLRTVRGQGHRFVAPVHIRSRVILTDQSKPSAMPPIPGERPTIAVLPFSRFGAAEEHANLADAIPSEIISSLARLRWLRVIARESSFRFRTATADLGALHAVLGAGYCLSGRLEMTGQKLSVSVDLVDTRDGSLVWSDHFARTLDEVHAIRLEIVAAVIAALDLQIPQAEAALARVKPIEALDAWGAYHLGLSHMYRFNSHDNAIAAGFLTRAITLDPSFASAFAARSFTKTQDFILGYNPDRAAAVSAARQDAERSIELDPLDPYANFAMGRVPILTGRPEDGLIWLDRSLQLSPNYAKGHYSRAFLQVLCASTTEARQGIDVATGLSPLDPLMGAMLMMRSLSFGIDGDYVKAAEWAVRATRMAGNHFCGMIIAVTMCHLAGQTEAAAHWANVLRERRPDASISLFFAGVPLVDVDFCAKVRAALIACGIPD